MRIWHKAVRVGSPQVEAQFADDQHALTSHRRRNIAQRKRPGVKLRGSERFRAARGKKPVEISESSTFVPVLAAKASVEFQIGGDRGAKHGFAGAMRVHGKSSLVGRSSAASRKSSAFRRR